MTEEYRQKLVNWLTSMLVLMLVGSSALATHWFFVAPRSQLFPSNDFAEYALSLGENLYFYIVGFPVLAFWHFCDFFDKGQGSGPRFALLASYSVFCSALLISGTLAVLMASGLSSGYRPCGGGGQFACFMPSPFMMMANLVSFLLLLVLCLCKAAIAIRSLFMKAS